MQQCNANPIQTLILNPTCMSIRCDYSPALTSPLFSTWIHPYKHFTNPHPYPRKPTPTPLPPLSRSTQHWTPGKPGASIPSLPPCSLSYHQRPFTHINPSSPFPPNPKRCIYTSELPANFPNQTGTENGICSSVPGWKACAGNPEQCSSDQAKVMDPQCLTPALATAATPADSPADMPPAIVQICLKLLQYFSRTSFFL